MSEPIAVERARKHLRLLQLQWGSRITPAVSENFGRMWALALKVDPEGSTLAPLVNGLRAALESEGRRAMDELIKAYLAKAGTIHYAPRGRRTFTEAQMKRLVEDEMLEVELPTKAEQRAAKAALSITARGLTIALNDAGDWMEVKR